MIGFIFFGLIVGAVARLLVPGRQQLGLLTTLLLGVVGSVIGGLVANLLGTGGIFELNVLGAIVAFLSAAALVGVAEGITARSA
ncbi:MAG: GlsB/YeaQ/YmgE family stress response membrane protein [Acidimicrobiales bacterium]